MKDKYQPGQRVILPEGIIGTIEAESLVGEYMIKSGSKYYYYYAEDLKPYPYKEEQDEV